MGAGEETLSIETKGFGSSNLGRMTRLEEFFPDQ
jgi:hypothetical protein